MAGGRSGKDRSQVLDLGGYLSTGDIAALGNWTDGPDLPRVMADTSFALLDDGSFVMVGSRVQKKVWHDWWHHGAFS